MPAAQTISEVIAQVIVESATEREKSIALHDYVREKVKFGFNDRFDAAEPDYTLGFGFGHCNPKSRLLVALFRAVGLESYQHFVAIPKDILKGAVPASRYWMMPAELSHSYVEVKVEGAWCTLDSHIIDTPLLRGAQDRLIREGRSPGYGVRSDSTNTWDGQGNAFSQFDPSMMIEDHGRVDDLEAYFRDRKYRNRVLGLNFNTMFKMMGSSGVTPINGHIEKLRQ